MECSKTSTGLRINSLTGNRTVLNIRVSDSNIYVVISGRPEGNGTEWNEGLVQKAEEMKTSTLGLDSRLAERPIYRPDATTQTT